MTTERQTIFVKHNAEIAHRLSLLPGKCQQIHGHSLQIQVEMVVQIGPEGIALSGVLETLDFGFVKRKVREYIDSQFDHHLLLNVEDELFDLVGVPGAAETYFPGLMTMPGDPTIENIARWIGEWCRDEFSPKGIGVRIDETNTNGASWASL